MQEKQGFEPWVHYKLYDRLAIYCFRPLSHFSQINESKFFNDFFIYILLSKKRKWLWWDLNLRPWAYESPALTTELQSLKLLY